MDSIQVVSENDELELSNLIDINFEISFFLKDYYDILWVFLLNNLEESCRS